MFSKNVNKKLGLVKYCYFSKYWIEKRFKHQTIELSSSSEKDNMIHKGELFFRKNLTIDLPSVHAD